MPITDRNLQPGTRLVAKYKGTTHIAILLEDGTFEVDDHGAKFKSLSAAGSAIMGGIACNGWRFWTVEGGEPESMEQRTANVAGAIDGHLDKVAKRVKKQRTYNPIKKMPNQKGLEDGQVRYWCDGCMASFTSSPALAPSADINDDRYVCPNGHSVGQMREAANAAAGEEPYNGETPAAVEMEAAEV